MNKVQEAFLRKCLKPAVESDLPGRLRISFSKYSLLPKEAAPYLHYVGEVLEMLPGVLNAEVNPRIGTALIRYDAKQTTAQAILRWIDLVVDEGICIFRETAWQGASEEELANLARNRLKLRLPKTRVQN